jgi:hypothetical protein
MDDGYCLFIIFTGLLTFAMPNPVQPPFAVIAFALVLACRVGPAAEKRGPHEERDRHGAGR